MITLDGDLRTDDMILASLLSMNGYSPIMEQLGKKRVVWVLPEEDVDEPMCILIEDYKRNACRVEPKRFFRELRHVRKELYAMLGISSTASS